MITKILTSQTYKEILSEIFLNNNETVTKLSDSDVINSILFGEAKLAQRTAKDLALIEAQIFSQSASGSNLDDIARRRGVAPRFSTSGSSTYVRLVGDVGTFYTAITTQFTGSDGINFQLEEDTTVGIGGYVYAKVSSIETGEKTNVAPLTLNEINVAPIGHNYVINEYRAIGGRDFESDDVFRQRIQKSLNQFAKSTLEALTQVFNKIDSRVLRVFNFGNQKNGKIKLAVLSVDGANFTVSELNNLIVNADKFLSLSDARLNGLGFIGLELTNIQFQEIDISFRAEFNPSFDLDEARIEIQTEMAKYLDYRFWDYTKKVEWDDLLLIVKNNPAVKYVYDRFFFPNSDILISRNKLPRVRGFLMLDKQGNLVADEVSNLNPVFYPSNKDFGFQSSVLTNI